MSKTFQATHWGTLCAIAAAFLFASKAIFIKQVYALSPTVDATLLMALRMLCALPFFLIMAWYFRSQRQQTTRQDWGLLVAAGLLGYYFASWLDFKGLMYISASLERIILFLYPTLTVFAASLVYKQALTRRTLWALLLSYGGTVIVMLQEYQHNAFSSHTWLGASLVFASAIAFAIYLVMSPRLIQRFGTWHFTGLVMSIACLGMLTHYLVAVPLPLQTLIQLPVEIWMYGLILGIFVTVLPTSLLIQSIARLGPARSSIIASIGPILTLLMATLILKEHLTALQWFGCVLNICGVLMISTFKAKS